MNIVQSNYIISKAHLDTLEAVLQEKEQQYLVDQGITNPDGTVPKAIYCIEDEAIFDKANAEFGAIVDTSAEWEEILEAREMVKHAEAQLVAWGLSFLPPTEKATLEKEADRNVTVRWKVRDLALKLDTSTLK